jgi:UDPglucose 6-dehydrogenase
MKIGVVGLWHLGSVVSCAWAKLGNDVVGFDYDTNIIDNLSKGKAPLFEPGLDDEIQTQISEGRLRFSNNKSCLSACDYVFITYDTPVDENDVIDTSPITDTIDDIKWGLALNTTVIVSSQSPVGFCDVIQNKLKRINPTYELAYSPENLKLGEALDRYLHPGRIIIGASNKFSKSKAMHLFFQIEAEQITMDLKSAEMVKHGINSFLATSIVFADQLADICEKLDVNFAEVVKGMKSDPRIGKNAYLSTGIGFSGATLGRDLKILSDADNLFDSVYEWNKERGNTIVDKFRTFTNGLLDRKIGVLGVTYKPNTSTLRNSTPLKIIDIMIEEGANVMVYDPHADYTELEGEPKFKIVKYLEDVIFESDYLIILTECDEFKKYDFGNVKIFNPYESNYNQRSK